MARKKEQQVLERQLSTKELKGIEKKKKVILRNRAMPELMSLEQRQRLMMDKAREDYNRDWMRHMDFMKDHPNYCLIPAPAKKVKVPAGMPAVPYIVDPPDIISPGIPMQATCKKTCSASNEPGIPTCDTQTDEAGSAGRMSFSESYWTEVDVIDDIIDDVPF